MSEEIHEHDENYLQKKAKKEGASRIIIFHDPLDDNNETFVFFCFPDNTEEKRRKFLSNVFVKDIPLE